LNSDEDKLLENQLQAYGENITFDFKDLMPESKDKVQREQEKDPRFKRINKILDYVDEQTQIQ
jgi:hypothetical protein